MDNPSDGICDGRLNRVELLVGADAMRRIRDARVIVFGVGGVGSWAAEALVRSGISDLTIVDAVVTTFSKRKIYLYLRNVHIFWLLYTFAAVFCTPLIESQVGEIFYIGLIIAVIVFIQKNITIAIRHDTPGYILLNVWLFFIFAPFYSRRVLKNNWL